MNNSQECHPNGWPLQEWWNSCVKTFPTRLRQQNPLLSHMSTKDSSHLLQEIGCAFASEYHSVGSLWYWQNCPTAVAVPPIFNANSRIVIRGIMPPIVMVMIEETLPFIPTLSECYRFISHMTYDVWDMQLDSRSCDMLMDWCVIASIWGKIRFDMQLLQRRKTLINHHLIFIHCWLFNYI